jgi:hypothetical protein
MINDIVNTLKLICEYQWRTPDDRSGGEWHTISLNYYTKNQWQALCIYQKEKAIKWTDIHSTYKDSYSHTEIPIDINHPIFVRKIKHILKYNPKFKEILNDKLFQLEEITLIEL